MKISNINTCSNKSLYNISMRSKVDQNNQVQKKTDYINAKTEALSDIGAALLILGLLTDGANIRMAKKRSVAQKFGVGFIIASFIAFMSGSISKIKYAHKYKGEDKRNDK